MILSPFADYRDRDWVGFVRFLRCLFSLCIILYRTQCDTTCLSTNVSCESKTWKGPYGRWTKWSFTRDAHNALAARPGTLPLPMPHRSEKIITTALFTLFILFLSHFLFLSHRYFLLPLRLPSSRSGDQRDWSPNTHSFSRIYRGDNSSGFYSISRNPIFYIYIYISILHFLSLSLSFYIYLNHVYIHSYSLLLYL